MAQVDIILFAVATKPYFLADEKMAEFLKCLALILVLHYSASVLKTWPL